MTLASVGLVAHRGAASGEGTRKRKLLGESEIEDPATGGGRGGLPRTQVTLRAGYVAALFRGKGSCGKQFVMLIV